MGKLEYRVLVDDEEDSLEIVDSEGNSLDRFELMLLYNKIISRYEHKLAIYIADGVADPHGNDTKIGVSNNPGRRGKEVKAHPMNWVTCSIRTAWKLERALQQKLRFWRVEGEWFRFDDDFGKACYERLIKMQTEQELWAFVREPFPRVYWESRHERQHAR